MEVTPAHINQVQVGRDGRIYEISADDSTVAADLQAIDKGLKVRFVEQTGCFIVMHVRHGDCPHNGTADAYMVKSVQGHQGRTGVWTGLDQRIVDRIRYIQPGGRSGYDYVQALEDRREQRVKREKDELAEKHGEMAERMAHALRKDLGERYKGRTFVPREIPK